MTQLPIIHTDNPQGLPPVYAYRIGQGMVAPLPANPDHDPPKVVVLPKAGQARKTTNGLTARADAMARWVAHGASIADAMRMAYRSKKTGSALTAQAGRVARNPKWRAALALYVERIQEERRQATVGMRDFVTLRLAHEAQTAKTDAARVASLRLLGMTEGMFTTVHKRETTLDPKQLDQLKAKLDQRLRETLARLGGAAVPVHGPDPEAIEAEILPPEGYSSGDPLVASGSHATMPDTIVGTQSPHSPAPLPGLGPLPDGSPLAVGPSPGGSHPADIAAGYASDFDGPLILQGGLREP